MVERMFDRMGKSGFALVLAGIFGSQFVFVVDGGERALIMDKTSGLKNKVYGEGMHLLIPGVQTVKRFQIRARP